MSIFKIEDLYVEEKKLGKVAWALEGMTLGRPTFVPVKGAKASGGKVKATTTNNGSAMHEQVAAYISTHHLKEVNAADIRKIVVALGGSPNSTSNSTYKLQKAKFLRKKKGTTGKDTKYVVIGK